MIYKKNLNSEFRLRLTDEDMDFLRNLSNSRNVSVSEVVRSIVGEYRRSYTAFETLSKTVELINKNGGAVHGDTKADFNDQL